jgi:hypothetical protein
MIFPDLSAHKPDGKQVRLPDGLAGEYNVVVVAFQMRQQVEVESWMSLLRSLTFHYPNFDYYMLATMQDTPGWRGEFLDMGQRLRLADGHARQNLLSLYTDLNDFNRALDIPTVSQTYTLLLDRMGKILWRTEGGAFTPERARGLTRALEQRQPVMPLWRKALPLLASLASAI